MLDEELTVALCIEDSGTRAVEPHIDRARSDILECGNILDLATLFCLQAVKQLLVPYHMASPAMPRLFLPQVSEYTVIRGDRPRNDVFN